MVVYSKLLDTKQVIIIIRFNLGPGVMLSETIKINLNFDDFFYDIM